MDGYHRILVPTDFSPITTNVLEHAKRLADTFQSKLHLLHVVEDPVVGVALEESYVLPANFVKHAEQQAHRQLEQVVNIDERARYRMELVLREGSPFVEIVRYAREQQIDLIVMGTHGRGAIAHMLVGSVTRQVLRHAACPVLIVPNPDRSVSLP